MKDKDIKDMMDQIERMAKKSYGNDYDIMESIKRQRKRFEKDTYSRDIVNDSFIDADAVADRIWYLFENISSWIKKTVTKSFELFENIKSGGNGGGGDDGSNKPPFNFRGNLKMNGKSIGAIVVIVLALCISPLFFGINDAGHRTVIQYPTGTLVTKFEPGLYMQNFGEVTIYNDVITMDFDKSVNPEGTTLDQAGIAVRYQDGGTGTVYGIARFRLPVDEKSMVKLHKEFRSNKGVAHKIIRNTTEEIMNHTAGLVSSEESYTDRGTYTQRAKTQLRLGKFATVQDTITTVEAGMEFCLGADLTPVLKKECHNVKKTKKVIPIIATLNGVPKHVTNDLEQYGITLSGFNMVDWGYEAKTLDQIAAKREATMAIITSKANAERAKQDTITAEQQGLANVKKAEFLEEVEKVKQVVIAQRKAEVAIIKATQLVDVAEQQKHEAEQKKLAAYEEKKRQIALGEGESTRKKLNMQADGALQAKLDAYVKVQSRFAQAVEKQKWVPEVMMGASAKNGGSGSAATDLIDMFNVKTARELSLDMTMKSKSSR